MGRVYLSKTNRGRGGPKGLIPKPEPVIGLLD